MIRNNSLRIVRLRAPSPSAHTIVALALAGVMAGGAVAKDEADAQDAAVTQEAAVAPVDDLSKQLSNPVASLISLPFQNNFDFGMGSSESGSRYTLNVQPVIPLDISRDWNLIIRTILPFIAQDDVVSGTSQQGLGDTVQSFFFSPKEPVGGWILAAGPVFSWPTATDDLLGNQIWGVGPTALALRQNKGWTYGMLVNHIWSYAGEGTVDIFDSDAAVDSTYIQPFVSYTTDAKVTYGLDVEAPYDWQESQWTVSLNPYIGKLVKFGEQPVQFRFGGRYFAEGPVSAPDWGIRFSVNFLFPK